MEKSEQSLVPEWLKGAGAGVGNVGSGHHPSVSLPQDEGGLSYSFRPRGDSPRYSANILRRAGNGNERSVYDKDLSSSSRIYPNFGRSSSYRGYESGGDREREQWTDREVERERDFRLGGGFVSDSKDRDYERTDASAFKWYNSSSAIRHEANYPLRRAQSMGSASRIPENGEKKASNENVATIPGAAFASRVQKAAFDRNFPSLGAQEKLNGMRSIRQSPLSASEGGRVLSPNPGTQSHISMGSLGTVLETWNSSTEPASIGNVQSAPLTSSLPGQQPNMAEALVQNPPRVRTPPQTLTEAQRLEELALKQCRQLIPITPSFPKPLSSSSWEKLKPNKPTRTVDVLTSSIPKPTQIQSPSYRTQASPRPEITKVTQGKLLVLKTSRESVVLAPKADTTSPPPVSGTVTAGNGNSRNMMAGNGRQLIVDRRVGHTIGADGGVTRSKESEISEDKRPQIHVQNRSDFFNTLRKKAANSQVVSDSTEKSGSSSQQKTTEDEPSNKLVTKSTTECKCNGHIGDNKASKDASSVDRVTEKQVQTIMEVSSGKDAAAEAQLVSGPEEEEAAFLRSLGWEESTGEEALTEEEINAFYKEHMRSVAKIPHNLRLRKAVMGLPVGSLCSNASGMSSSDSDSDDELQH